MPSKRMFKFGAATFAAVTGVILAITSAGAHSTPSAHPAPVSHANLTVLHQIVTSAMFAAGPMAINDPASSEMLAEQDQDAQEAAALAAKIAAEQAELAAKLAALRAEEAAEAAANSCVAADRTEDAAERAADQAEDSAEMTNGSESATEDSSEMAARLATDKPEDAAEVRCLAAEEEHFSFDNHEGSSTFSFEGEQH